MQTIAATPKAPYFAVIFTAQHTGPDPEYDVTGADMFELVQQMDGFLGAESFQDENGLGVTISYWRDRASIATWKAQEAHKAAQQRGKAQWYANYKIRICKVVEDYGFGL